VGRDRDMREGTGEEGMTGEGEEGWGRKRRYREHVGQEGG